jgi:hypothetical protein
MDQSSHQSDEPFVLRQRRLPGARFEEVDLSGARFAQVNLAGASIHGADATDLDVREVYFADARFRGVVLDRVDIDGQLGHVVINGVEVGPLIEAELDRRHPERVRLRPTTPAGFREAWDLVEQLWSGTVERARRLERVDPALLHERVDDEWSFVDTLRHLALATECWLHKVVLGDPAPWHPLSLPTEDDEDIPCDRAARPTLDETLAYRHDRMEAVRRYVDALTDERLASHTEPVDGPGGPPPRSRPVHEALQVILNEEWLHRQFALRDLAVLEERVGLPPERSDHGA